jgi:hypothetical protein
MRTLLMMMVLVAGMAQAAEPVLTPHTSSYDVQWGSITLGDGSITLSPLVGKEKDCYRYESTTQPIGLVKVLYGSPYELSTFCVRNGVIRSKHYEFSIKKNSDDNFSMDFDWTTRKVKTLKQGTLTARDIPDDTYDRFVLREVVRLWVKQHGEALKKGDELAFKMMDDDSVNDYRFVFQGRETVKTPAGAFETLRVDRVNDPNRVLRTWFAPTRDYTIVELEQFRNGKVDLRLLLNK